MTTRRAVARFATDDERARWDDLVAANPGGGEVWQADDYLEHKRLGRYVPLRVIVERHDAEPLAVGILTKRVPLLGAWWHVPAGPRPDTSGDPLAELDEVVTAIADLAASRGAFLLKVEPRLAPTAEFHRFADEHGWVRHARIIPNDSTVLVDVSGSEEDVFRRIGKRARNSINRAKRDGIVVRRVSASDDNTRAFADLLAETAEGKFVMRIPDYYREFWKRFQSSGTGQLFFAERDGTLLAGAFVMRLGKTTTYKDGASLRDKQAYGASHILQWEALRWANEQGADTHDLCGAPPSEQADNPEHPLHGVGRFKRSFQPNITDYVGLYDVPLRRRAYRIWASVIERLARRLSLWIRKDPYY